MTQMRTSPLPNPEYRREMYQDVPTKRFFAWVIDIAIIAMITLVLTFFSLFTALFFLPLLYGTVSFLYRWSALASGSATLGMRFMAIQILTAEGHRLDGQTALLHTAGYFVSVVTFPLQLVSIAMMLGTARNQGLSDTVLGTVAVNRLAD
ncbi:MAG: RDD family protein [Silicimonas sp.]|nr:RDD family protein [Silicimonas sp.]